MSIMKAFPLLLQLRDFIAGNGFVAHVHLDGRALMVTEDDGEVWIYGVQPGGVAGGASQGPEALNEFKTRYLSVLFDFADEARTFAEFKRSVEDFFKYVDSTDEATWTEALKTVRKTNVSLAMLPTISADAVPSRVVVHELVNVQPEMNELPQPEVSQAVLLDAA